MNEQETCNYELERLADFVDGTLPALDSATIRAHLDGGCNMCREAVGWLAQLIDGVRGAGRIVPPAYSLDSVKALYRERMLSSKRRPLLARLVLDTRLSPAYGLRGGPPQAFKLVYSTAVHDIDLWNEPQMDGGWYLIGQALPRDGSPPIPPELATITPNGAAPVALTMDGAEFHASGLISGTYDLHLVLQGEDMRVPQVRIGA